MVDESGSVIEGGIEGCIIRTYRSIGHKVIPGKPTAKMDSTQYYYRIRGKKWIRSRDMLIFNSVQLSFMKEEPLKTRYTTWATRTQYEKLSKIGGLFRQLKRLLRFEPGEGVRLFCQAADDPGIEAVTTAERAGLPCKGSSMTL